MSRELSRMQSAQAVRQVLTGDNMIIRNHIKSRRRRRVFQRSREMWSMPPDHGGAVVRTLLQDAALTADWRVELDEMRGRILRIRERLAKADPRLEFIRHQMGMFSMLPVTPEQVLELRDRHAIYMADSGRFNVLGMADHALDRFIAAIIEAMDG